MRFHGTCILVFLVAYCGVRQTAMAQDLVVHANGDSINCRVRGSDRNGLHVERIVNGRRAQVYYLNRDIQHWEKEFYGRAMRQRGDRQAARDHARFRIGVIGGGGMLLAPINQDQPLYLQEHDEQLRSGRFMAGEGHFHVHRNWGVGVFYGITRYQARTEDALFRMVDGTIVPGLLSEDIRVRFLGASVAYMPVSRSGRLAGVVSMALGAVRFHEKAVLIMPLELEGSTIGFRTAGTFEYRIPSGFGFGVTGALTIATLTNLNLAGDSDAIDLLGPNFIGLSRMDVGLSVSYTL